jgi:hypothetical protein
MSEEHESQSTDRFAGFGREVMECIFGMDEWWGDDLLNDYFLPIAKNHGLAQFAPYDPTVHGDGIDADLGDMIWWIDRKKWPATDDVIAKLYTEINHISKERDEMKRAAGDLLVENRWQAERAMKLFADIERIGHERDQMVAANVELQERLSRLEDDLK